MEKPPGPQNEIFIRRGSPGISYNRWDENATDQRKMNSATQKRKICDMEIENVTFVNNGSDKFTVPVNVVIQGVPKVG